MKYYKGDKKMNQILNDQNLSDEAKKVLGGVMEEVKSEIELGKELADMEMIEESQNNLSELILGLEQVNKDIEKESDKMSIETDIALSDEK